QTLTRQVRVAGVGTTTGAATPAPATIEYTLPAASGGGVAAGWLGQVQTSRADGTAIGTALPGGGTPYHWFFPQGTQLLVTGSRAGQLRVRLTDDLSVWVDSSEVRPADDGTGLVPRAEDRLRPIAGFAGGSVGNVVATPYADWIDIRIPVSSRLPFRVDGRERGLTVDVYGGATRTNNL